MSVARVVQPSAPLPATRHRRLPGLARFAVLQGQVIVAATLVFVAFTCLGMLLYPGGAKFDRASRHYSFVGNFFSDLGARVTDGGLDNTISRVLFVLALGGVGAGLLTFAPCWRFVVLRSGRAKAVGWLAETTGSACALCFVAVGLIPWDVNLRLHDGLVRLAFALLLVFVAGLTWVQAANGWPHVYLRANLAYVGLLTVYVYVLFWGPSLAEPNGFAFQVVAQKVIAYASILNLGFQGLGLRRAAATC